MDRREALRRYFGYEDFRPGQDALIDAVLAGQDCLGIMPTGGGKSLCYQVPALLLPGVTLVISPLISLMQDQVAALRENGVGAAYINSTQSQKEYAEVLDGLRAGKYRLLYVAPERLELAGFRNTLSRLEVPLVAVDEAHCVSQWGQDFRPSYLKIAPAIASLSRRPTVAAFTATATERVRSDIIELLELRSPKVLVTGFDRPNLYFEVRNPKDKKRELLKLLRERREKSGIIYCATRAAVDEVCMLLRERGYNAVRYHAGLTDGERAGAQEAFQYDEAPVMVATNAFGMGIDKSNVGFVIHYNMPKSLDAYYQEAGRAGRDGSDADCILLYASRDIMTAKYLIEHGEHADAASLEADIERLNAIIGYCTTGRCLRGYILGYFGQEHPEECGNCGNCLGDNETVDITLEAQQALSCIQRVKNQLGFAVGKKLITDVLLGMRTQKVDELGLTGLTTWGLMKDKSASQVSAVLDALIDGNYAARNEHQALYVTRKGAEVLFHGEKVSMLLRVYAEKRASARAQRPVRAGYTIKKPQIRDRAVAGSAELYERLRVLRARLAREAEVPAYVVFSNATLQTMAELAPVTWDELLEVPGVGEKKAERYGQEFLAEIARFIRR